MRYRNEIQLVGLDGSNLLAFMAAIGTLRTLSLGSADEVRMKWVRCSGAWRPVVHHSNIASGEDLVSELMHRLSPDSNPNPAFTMARNLTLSPEKFAVEAHNAVAAASPKSRAWADFLAAFACEACAKEGKIRDTALRTMSGAGHQDFLGSMTKLHRETLADDLRRSLFELWAYSDPPPSMRWNPEDYRPHALRALDPSTDEIRTVRGGNRLAIEALPLFPTFPSTRGLATTGFTSFDKTPCLTWPIWDHPLGCETVCSVLALPELQQPQPDRGALASRGITQVYRARRFTDGKFRNFSLAQELL